MTLSTPPSKTPDVARLCETSAEALLHLVAESHVDRSIAAPTPSSTPISSARTACSRPAERCGSARMARSAPTAARLHRRGLPPRPRRRPVPQGLRRPQSPYSASKARPIISFAPTTRPMGRRRSPPLPNNYGPYQHGKVDPLRADRDAPRPAGWTLRRRIACPGLAARRRPLPRTVAALAHGAPGSPTDRAANTKRRTSPWCAHRRLIARAFVDDGLRERFDCPSAHGERTTIWSPWSTPPGHDRRYAMNTARAAAELNYAPQTDFASGLSATVRWYLDRL